MIWPMTCLNHYKNQPAMKYRRLTNEELKKLESDFLKFLENNEISLEQWNHILETDAVLAEEWIATYSDNVLQKSLENVGYLEDRRPKEFKLYRCAEDRIFLIALNANEQNALDFTNMEGVNQLSPDDYSVFKSDKPYIPSREEEIYQLMQKGCVKTNGRLFDILACMP